MLPYFLFIIFILFFYIQKKPIGMLFIMILFAALRFETGWDYASYVDTVSNPEYWSNPNTSRYSFFWRNLFKLSYLFKQPHIAIILPNIISYIIIYWGLNLLNLNRQQKVDALFVYVTWYEFYLGSFSTIRQSIAIAFGIMMFALIQRKSLLLSLIPYIIAIHLHTSALILVLLYPVFLLRKFLNVRWLFIASILLLVMLSGLESLIGSLDSFDISQYSRYLRSKDGYGGKIIYVNIIIVIYLLFAFFMAVNQKKRMEWVSKECLFMTIIAFIGKIAIYLMDFSNIINRSLSYFMIFLILVLLPSLSMFKGYRILRIYGVSFLTLYFFVYLYLTQAGVKVASSGFVPYKCILFY